MPIESSVDKYLNVWAQPESVSLSAQLGEYNAALIVPVLGEAHSLLDGYRKAAEHAEGRVLVVLVVNASASVAPEYRDQNQALLQALSGRGRPLSAGATLVAEPEFDLLALDHSSEHRELSEKRGVGLARKIGGDIVLALAAQGRLQRPILFFTDADAELPLDYFRRGREIHGSPAGAFLYPFCHVTGADPDVDWATQLYELSLRYHVLGLAYAGSPYAYHSIGSTIAVPAASYAAVRGVPQRNAGEDFYFLDKLAKIAPLRRLDGKPVRLKSRCSLRVPFGTGPRVAQILSSGELHVTSPVVYEVLRKLIQAINSYAQHPNDKVFERALGELPGAVTGAARGAFAESGLLAAITDAASRTNPTDLPRRIHCWFDALRTLRFLHALKAAGIVDVPWSQAAQSAPFVSWRGSSVLDAVLTKLVELESALPADVGVALLHGANYNL